MRYVLLMEFSMEKPSYCIYDSVEKRKTWFANTIQDSLYMANKGDTDMGLYETVETIMRDDDYSNVTVLGEMDSLEDIENKFPEYFV